LDIEGMGVVSEEPIGYVASPINSRTISTFSHHSNHSNSSAISDDDNALSSLAGVGIGAGGGVGSSSGNNILSLGGVTSPHVSDEAPLVGHHTITTRIARSDDMRL
jgi:hypothetical protein